MSALILLSIFIGAALGTRFKVLILIPAVGVISIFVFATGILGGDGIAAAVLAAILAAIFLQFGYVSLIFIRSSVAPGKAGALANVSRSAWLPK